MSNQVWKEFEDNALTHSAAHYLMTIHELRQDQGYARVTDIAKRLNITRGSCSISLKPLKKRGLVVEDENKFLSLSEEGLRLTTIVERNDELLENLFHDVFGMDQEQAEIDACKIEHLLSIEASVALANFIKVFHSNRKAAKDFAKVLEQSNTTCTHDAESCDICQNLCFFEPSELKKK